MNRVTGYKYRYERGDWEKFMQPITDKLCVKYGLPKLEYEKGNRKGVSYGEWKDQGKSSWKNLIRADIDYAISLSESYEEFLEQMRSMHYQIQEGTSREEGAILSLKLPGQGRACRTKKKTLGEAYTVAAIRERIGKEWRSYPVPKPPRLQRCQMHFGRKNIRGISGYQASHVRDIYQIQNRYARGNIYAINQGSMRKHLTEIEKLRADCRYLLTMDIRSREALEQREREVLKEEKRLKQQSSLKWNMQEDEGYRRYQKLEQELGQIPVWDDRFEAVLDEMEELQEQLPKGMELMKDAKEQLQKLREEKRLIRQIKRMDQEHLATYEFAHPIQRKNPEQTRSEIRNRKKGDRQWKPRL